MSPNDLTYKQIENYDPFNERANANGMVKEWCGYNHYGVAVAFGYTKRECYADARRYCEEYNRSHK